MKTIKFKTWNCKIVLGQYANKRLAIKLIDVEDNAPVATATVNLVNEILPSEHVHIKEWGENEGITQVLVNAGIITYTGKKIVVNQYADYANLCRLVRKTKNDG